MTRGEEHKTVRAAVADPFFLTMFLLGQPPGTLRLESRVGRALFGVVYFAGLFLWGRFFEWGDVRFSAFDWPKEYAYLDVLQQAIVEFRIPLHTHPDFQGTARFLANPEVPLSPQLLLLRWLSVPRYIVANWLLLYTCGAIGTYALACRLRLALLPAIFLFIVFAFNGHIVAHVSVGHSMWSGYFLFPLVAVTLLRLLHQSHGTMESRTVGLAVVLALCMAQGAFHITAWVLGFVALAGIAYRGARLATLASFTLFALLTAYRWLPAVVAFSQLRRPANLGYPSLEVLADSLVTIRDWNAPPIEHIGWWEYDVFLGAWGTALVIFFSVIAVVSRAEHRMLLVPIGIILGLSMGDTFRPIADLPLSSIENAFAHRPFGPAAIIWRDDPRYFVSLGAGWVTSVSTLVWLASFPVRRYRPVVLRWRALEARRGGASGSADA